MQILIALLVLSFLILIHELGHFIVAKAVGIKVQEFSLFMGPKIFSVRFGETIYSLRLIPIGGFVKMEGEEEASEDDRSYGKKPVWARMLVVVMGPAINILFAIIAFAFVTSHYFNGVYPTTVVGKLTEGFPAAKAGIMPGDRLENINGEKLYVYEQFKIFMAQNGDREITLTVNRAGRMMDVGLKPIKDKNGNSGYYIGITPQFSRNLPGFVNHGFLQSVWYTRMTFSGFGGLLTGKLPLNAVSGPVGIVTEIGKAAVATAQETAADVFMRLLYIGAVISLSLGIINLLPIPALDGSKIVIFLVELVRRKPLPPEKEAYITMVGFVLLITLMLVITFNDIRKYFPG